MSACVTRRACLAAGIATMSGAGRRVRAAAATVAITGARIHPADGRVIDDGTIVIAGGKVAAVGPRAEIKVPDGAEVIDGRGTWVTPGLFDAEALTGLVDVQLERDTRDVGLDAHYDPVRASLSVLDGWNPRSLVIPITRNEGVTANALAPKLGLVSGRGAIVRFSDGDVGAATLKAPTAMYADFGLGGRKLTFQSRAGLFLKVRELLDDVRQYARRRQDFERNGMRKLAASRLDLEALIPVVEGRLPLVVEVARASDIEAVLRLGREEKLKLILTGCEEGWRVADQIASARVAVIVNALMDLPRDFDSLGSRLENPALLARAGVEVVLSPREKEDHDSRTLRFQAGNAVANGLPWEDGLAAITRRPAQLFGVDDRIGTLAPGKLADLVVWSGDPFEPLTRPRHVFVGGVDMPLSSRQGLLRDRYRHPTTLRR